MNWISSAVLLLCVISSESVTTLNRLSSLRFEGPAGFIINDAKTIAAAYDGFHGITYVAGKLSRDIHMVDMSTPTAIALIDKETLALEDHEITDIKICGSQVAISTLPSNRLDNGNVLFYPLWTSTQRWTVPTHRVTVGVYPKSIKWNNDCTRIVVANEGPIAPNLLGIGWSDPEGSISDIQFIGGNPSTTTHDFISYNVDQPQPDGVRHTFKEGTTTFSQDMEPEHISLDSTGRYAFITLQENNALVRFDLNTHQITDFGTFGTKNWGNTFFDPSDNGVRARFEFNVNSLYQPDEIETFEHGETTYFITLNEGAYRSYSDLEDQIDYSDATAGNILVQSETVNITIGTDLVEALVNDDHLGRTLISNADGKDASGTAVQTLHIFGGRSFSIWAMSSSPTLPVTQYFDSFGTVEEHLNNLLPDVFNSGLYDNLNLSPAATMDETSNSIGPGLQGLTFADFNGKKLIIFGTKEIGAMFVYSLADLTPTFESLHRTGNTGSSWTALYGDDTNGASIGDAGISQIGFIGVSVSPNNEPLIYVVSEVSGTLSVYGFTET